MTCYAHISMVSCQKGPTSHAYAWHLGPFWQDTLDLSTQLGYETFDGNVPTYFITLTVH